MTRVARPYEMCVNGGAWVAITRREFERALKEWRVSPHIYDEFILQLQDGRTVRSPVNDAVHYREAPRQYDIFGG